MTDAVVFGRVGVDLTPPSPRTTLAAATSFVRSIGGYGGNVATGLARLGAQTALVSSVGDDGHGDHVRSFLGSEGVDVSSVTTRPGIRTQVAFFEAWPPETFPVTFHRSDPAPETLASVDDLVPAMSAARMAIVSGALLARDPARTAVLAAMERRVGGAAEPRPADGAGGRWTVLDVDWRPTLWTSPADAPDLVRAAAHLADVVIASDDELAATRLTPADLLELGVRLVAVKHGSAGSSAVSADGTTDVAGIAVEVVCGLGAGDAFAAAFCAATLAGEPVATALARANAAGAIVASRLMCSTAMPTGAEIDALLARSSTRRRGREAEALA
jgi:5-dehydro-2-deoxygluconokinase